MCLFAVQLLSCSNVTIGGENLISNLGGSGRILNAARVDLCLVWIYVHVCGKRFAIDRNTTMIFTSVLQLLPQTDARNYQINSIHLKLTAVWLGLIDILLSSWSTKVSLKTAAVSEWSQPWSLASKQPFKKQQDHKLFALSHSNSVCATVYNNRFPQCGCSFGKSSPRTQFPLDDLTKWRLNDNNKNNSNKWRQRNIGMK